jgi:hypothetical protein
MAKESFKAGEHKIWAMSRLMFKSAKRASLIENLRSLRGPVHGVATPEPARSRRATPLLLFQQ